MSNIPESTNATPAGQEVERLREALARTADEFDLILMRLRDGQSERAEGAAICGANDARAALATPSVATPADDAGEREGEVIADQLEQTLRDRDEARYKIVAFVNRHEIIAALRAAASPKAPSVAIGAGDVTPEDREAAADLISAYFPNDPAMQTLAQQYRDGHSQGVWASAFARHRLAALAAQSSPVERDNGGEA